MLPVSALRILFAVTIFTGSGLLFLIQPLAARVVLPLAGGTPAVWNTCVFFFQSLLLAGYAWGMFLTRRLSVTGQVMIHSLLLLGALALLPMLLNSSATMATAQSGFVWWTLKYLAVTTGPVVFLLAAGGIVLQKWFSAADRDPYHLYAAGNAGSLVALLAFPLLIEPYFNLARQRWIWTVAFAFFVAVSAGCGALIIRRARGKEKEKVTEADARATITWRRRLWWVSLTFIPSSLMLGVTLNVTTDIAPTPLFWIIPLALYLLTFTIAFARSQIISPLWPTRLMPGAAILLVLALAARATEPAWLLIALHLIFFFLAALVCHQTLAADRPAELHLPEFYLWVATGGLLGGLFNALIAPLVFNALVEYPLTILLACLIHPGREPMSGTIRERRLDLIFPPGLLGLVAGLAWLAAGMDIGAMERTALVFAVPMILINHFMIARPARFALGLGAVLLGSAIVTPEIERTLMAGRNFFGTLKVTLDRGGAARTLYHGTTVHGRQSLRPGKQCEPSSYFHRSGPLGQIFAAYHARAVAPDVAVVGLGAGAMACYARKGERWTFYEINPLVIRLARDTGHFTYLHLCAPAPVEIVAGDARQSLRQTSDVYGLIVIDAFNSDAIPIHLLTREAIELYLSKLAPGGMIAFHISNRHLRLQPVLAALAEDQKLTALGCDDHETDQASGKDASQWVALARSADDLGNLAQQSHWQRLVTEAGMQVWSDDYSNLWQALRW
jgi:hypothetical protein